MSGGGGGGDCEAVERRGLSSSCGALDGFYLYYSSYTYFY